MTIATEQVETQTFLVGETVFLRPVEKADAERSVALRDTPYPISTKRTEAWITEELAGKDLWGDDATLAIRRRPDDVIVGSVHVHSSSFVRCEVSAHIDPLYGERGLALKAEAIALTVSWLADERQIAMVLVKLPGSEPSVIDHLVSTGMRVSTRFRERYFLAGRRVDQMILQRFNADWVETLGDPASQELPRSGLGLARPKSARPKLTSSVSKNAVTVGERVYLRPYREQDITDYVTWARQETEVFFNHGRQLPCMAEELHYHNEDEKQEIPDFIPFAVCLKSNDAYIGEVCLVGPDFTNRTAETASWFRQDYRGRGLGSEAKHLLLDYTFNTLGLHMVESWVRFENTRSAAALRKQGYREAGQICWVSHRDGKFNNFVTFDLLADEWRALPITA